MSCGVRVAVVMAGVMVVIVAAADVVRVAGMGVFERGFVLACCHRLLHGSTGFAASLRRPGHAAATRWFDRVLTIVLTRHGHTDRSEPDQYLGQTIDVPLSDQGRAEATLLHDRLAGVAFDRVISSPLLRAQETARLVRPRDAIELDARLAEADYGEWEGRLVADIAAHDAARRAAWEDDPADVGPPGGERGLDVAARVRSLLDELIGADGQQPARRRPSLPAGRPQHPRPHLPRRCP